MTGRRAWSGILLFIVCMALFAAAHQGPAATGAEQKPRTPAAEPSVGFQAGETLEYRAGWQTFLTAATVRIAVQERREFYGRSAWHFQAQVATIPPVRYLYPVDDQFDSYADAQTLATLQFEQYLRELRRNENRIARFAPEGEPAAGDGPAVRVPAGTRDPLGAFYALREVDWERTNAVKMPVYDGKKLYEVRAQVAQPSGEVGVPAGRFKATRVEFRIFERGRERADIRVSAWFAKTHGRVPVLIEAGLPFGEIRAELSKM